MLGNLSEVGKVTREEFEKALYIRQPPVYYSLVIEKDGQVVCSGTLFIEQKILRNTGLCGHIEDIVRAKRDDLKGIGGVLVRALREIGEEAGCYKIILDCKEALLDFYGSCGFVKKEVQAVSYTEAVLENNRIRNE